MKKNTSKFTNQVRPANYAYLDKYGILKFVEEPSDKHVCVDISSYGFDCFTGYPKFDDATLTIEKDKGKITCREGAAYLSKHPGLTEIYDTLERLS